MKAKIQCLVGMIASGKSTYARNAARQGVICMNDDAIVNMLHADDYTLYDKSLKVLYKSIENQIIGTALAMKRPVLVDRGLNVSVEGRKRWLALAKSFDVSCEAIVFKNEGPEVHAKRRTKSDARGHDYGYWLGVASMHYAAYVEPELSEGFSKVHYISFEEIQQGKVIK
jgi:predicted kinase